MAQSTAYKHDSPRRATYQDVLDAPAHRVAEIVDGTLYTHPRPAAPHARASSSLGVKIGGPFDYDAGGPGGWWIIFEPELHPGEDIVVPDLAGWRRERMPDYPDTAYFTLAPDWVCEVLSASTRKVDLHEKRPIYAREGTGYLWLVDPVDRTLEAFELHEGQWLLIASAKDDEPVSIRPFDAITFSLGDLWPSTVAVHRKSGEHALAAAVRQGDIARVTALIQSGVDVNDADPNTGYTPLMWVISKYNVPDQAVRIAKELIDGGADVNAKDNNGMTPLGWARFHRTRLREPRLQRIAEQLVSILENASESGESG